MDDNAVALNNDYAHDTFPMYMIEEVKTLKANGIYISDFGGMGLNILEAFAI